MWIGMHLKHLLQSSLFGRETKVMMAILYCTKNKKRLMELMAILDLLSTIYEKQVINGLENGLTNLNLLYSLLGKLIVLETKFYKNEHRKHNSHNSGRCNSYFCWYYFN